MDFEKIGGGRSVDGTLLGNCTCFERAEVVDVFNKKKHQIE